MNIVINIKELFSNGLTEKNGLILRSEILKNFNSLENNSKIILDFSDIKLFATPFFNSCIGYFVLNYGPEKINNLIQLINISDLGKETYNHSFSNAIYIYNKKINTTDIGNITTNNLNN